MIFGYCRNIKRFVKVYLAMCWFYCFENGYIKFYDNGIFLWILIYFYVCYFRPKCWRLHKSFGQATIFLMIIISFILFYSLLSRCSLCTVLLFDSSFHWSNQPSREEQNVKERIHPEYTTSCTKY